MRDLRKIIGIHASGTGTLGQLEEALKENVTSCQILLGNPQRYWPRKESEFELVPIRKLVEEIQVVVHAPYVVNLAGSTDSKGWKMSLKSMFHTVEACVGRGIYRIVIHAGSAREVDTKLKQNWWGEQDIQNGKTSWLKAVSELEREFGRDLPLLLIENSASNNSPYKDLDRLGDIVKESPSLGICLDSAHWYASGHDFITDWEAIRVWKERIRVVHLNDYPYPKGKGLDRHSETSIGEGTIPKESFVKLVTEFEGRPIILEQMANYAVSYSNLTEWLKEGGLCEGGM